jgi:hypothetical protein
MRVGQTQISILLGKGRAWPHSESERLRKPKGDRYGNVYHWRHDPIDDLINCFFKGSILTTKTIKVPQHLDEIMKFCIFPVRKPFIVHRLFFLQRI